MSGRLLYVSGLLIFGLTCSVSATTVTNGDFSNDFISSPLPGDWTAPWGTVSWDGVNERAVLDEDFFAFSSTLEQGFTIPALGTDVSFDYTFNWTLDATSGWEPDAFTASLFDPSFNPILPGGFAEFFAHELYEDGTDATYYDSTLVTVSGDTVAVDLTGVALPQDAVLAFDLYGSDNGYTSQATVDNVEMTVIPEPVSMVSGLIGLSMVAAYLRRRLA